jgi:hypothetical protein
VGIASNLDRIPYVEFRYAPPQRMRVNVTQGIIISPELTPGRSYPGLRGIPQVLSKLSKIQNTKCATPRTPQVTTDILLVYVPGVNGQKLSKNMHSEAQFIVTDWSIKLTMA